MFSKLPGPLWVRILISLLVIAAAILVLMEYVFPWASQFSPWTESTIGLVLQS
ncbi:hypothetical protein ACQ3I4_15210 [Zafaria sp. Z1313]|uniref:hypothetical protein n=1 Tax=unclassified Zafaria TaxID=2828765 RepID=UPI002E75B666|nr:hypothetical protein [Zafaria sp. J156]MEE1621473.1 hypothetical protein [Zafaria sp. J156]